MSNLTLDLIRNSQVGTPGYIPSSVPIPTTTRPVAERVPAVRGAYSPKVAMTRPSQPQMTLIKTLLAEIEALDLSVAEAERRIANSLYLAGELTPGYGNGASQRIAHLKEIRSTLAASHRAAAPKIKYPAIPEGHYAVDTNEGHLAFYKVSVSKTGFRSVYLQVSDDFQELPSVQTLAILKKIEADGTLAASIRYGKELHVCGVCGKTLTHPVSRSLGIGPTCLSRLGG